MADKQFRIDADVSPFEEAMQRAATAAGRTTNDIKAQFQSLNAGFSQLKTIFAGVVAVFAGGEIAEKISQMAERAEEMRRSSDIFNLSTTALQGLEAMANRAGVSSEYLQRGMATLEQRMRQSGEQGGVLAARFEALGISTAELRDPTFSVQDAMERLGNSTNSSAALLGILGARGAQLIPLMRELARSHNAAAEAAQHVGALTDEEIAVLGRYHGQIQAVSTEWENFGSRVLSQVAPALGELQQQLFNVLTAGTKTGDLAETARSVAKEFLKWAAAAKDLYADISHIFQSFSTAATNLGNVLKAAATGHFAQAKAIWQQGTADLAAIDKVHTDQIKANHEALAKALIEIDQSALQPVDVTAKYKSSGELPQIAGFDKLQKLSERYAEREIANANKILDTMKAVEEEKQQAAEESALGQIGASERAVSEELRDGQISASQFLAQETALIHQRLEVQREYYAQKLSLAVGDEVAQTKIQVDIAKAEAQALKQEQEAENTARQASLAQWHMLGSRIESSFASNIAGMIEGTRTFSNAVRSIFTSLIDGIIQIFVRMAIQWAENMILGKTAAEGQVAANAGVAGSAGVASFAAAPWPIDIGAPAFGAAMAIAAGSYATAERGYDIPAGVNPVVQAHAREMILPADISETIRSMAHGPREEISGFAEHHNYNGAMHISALDAGSFAKMMNRPSNRRVVANALRQHVMRGGR